MAHWRFEVHVVGHEPFTPSQANAPHAVTCAASRSGVQRPSLPVAAHVSQAPVHALVQQRPAAQNPDAQSALSAHVAPSCPSG